MFLLATGVCDSVCWLLAHMMSVCWLCAQLTSVCGPLLGLPLGLEAPIMTPNGVILFSFFLSVCISWVLAYC